MKSKVQNLTDRQTDRQTRYNCIDVIKFIMAFAVVAIHTHPLEQCKSTLALCIYDNLVCIAVPFFFMASGYLISKKMSYPFVESDIYIIKKQLFKIIKMYIIWMLIYTPLAIYHNISENASFIKSCLVYIRNLLFIGEQYNSWPLWYLLSTIYSLLLIIILIKLKITPQKLLIVSFIFAILGFGLDWFSGIDTQLPTILFYFQKAVHYSTANGRIFRGMVYIPIGMYLAHNSYSFYKHMILLFLGFGLNCIVKNGFASSFILVFTVIGFLGIAEYIKLADNKIYSVLRDSSTIVYLIHMYVWSFYYFVMYKEKTYGMDCFLVTSLISVLVSLLYLHLKKYFNKKLEKS